MARNALVIGNAAYPGTYVLGNATNDANAISVALGNCGFNVKKILNASYAELDQAVMDFRKILVPDGAATLYFAGHGVQIDGENYLVGVDADPTDETATKYKSLKLSYLVEIMDKARSETNIIILDACRNNPWGASWTRSIGLGGWAPIVAPRGTLIAFSTSPGEKSYDGLGAHGRYTEALLQHIESVCPVETMFKRVRNTLTAVSIKKQIPWEHTSLIAEFYFNRSRNSPTTNYGDQAIRDGGFLMDPSKPAHLIIGGLRSRSWGPQRDATSHINAAALATFTSSERFLIGRGLYSAAIGDSRPAKSWVENFASYSSNIRLEDKQSLLEGMLFEIFFDSEGKLRDKPKNDLFNAIYPLSKYPQLTPSFEFIADALAQTDKSFHAFPDLHSNITVDVLTRFDTGREFPAVTGLMVGGRDILSLDGADFVDENGIPLYFRISQANLRTKISIGAVIPINRLHLNYPDLSEIPAQVLFPYGHSLIWKW